MSEPVLVLPAIEGDEVDDLLAWLAACRLTARRTAEHTRDAAQLAHDRLRAYALAAGMSRSEARDAALQVSEPIRRGAVELARTGAYLRLATVRITGTADGGNEADQAAPPPARGGNTPMPETTPAGQPADDEPDPLEALRAELPTISSTSLGQMTYDDLLTLNQTLHQAGPDVVPPHALAEVEEELARRRDEAYAEFERRLAELEARAEAEGTDPPRGQVQQDLYREVFDELEQQRMTDAAAAEPASPPPPAPGGHVIDETGVRDATHADHMGALRAAHEGLQAELASPEPTDQAQTDQAEPPAASGGWPGLLGDERLTAAERKRLANDRVLAAAAANPADSYVRDVAEEVIERRQANARITQWAAAEAARMPALDAPAAVDRITHATTPEEVALVAARLHGHDLHRTAQVLGVSSIDLPADTDEQRVRDMLVDELGHEMAIWGGGRGERLWGTKIRRNERDLRKRGIDWRHPQPDPDDRDG